MLCCPDSPVNRKQNSYTYLISNINPCIAREDRNDGLTDWWIHRDLCIYVYSLICMSLKLFSSLWIVKFKYAIFQQLYHDEEGDYILRIVSSNILT